jgi:hypothetical protein
MNNLDEELRRALRREEPPAGFADRVLASLPPAPANVAEFPARRRLPSRFTLAAAAALAAVATGSIWLAIPRGPIDGASGPALTPAVATTSTTPGTTPGVPAVPPPTTGPALYGPSTVVVAVADTPSSGTRAAARPRTPRPAQHGDAVEALRAAEQLRIALHITEDKLNVARREVRETAAVPES